MRSPLGTLAALLIAFASFCGACSDSGGIPWIMANNKVFYWAGTEFREPVSGPMSSGHYLAKLYGGPDRGAYATQKGKKEHEGLIYRLDDGAAELFTTFYYDVSSNYPGQYVSKSGRLFKWGKRFFAALSNNSHRTALPVEI